jgi:hypothetical protein
MMNGWMDGYLGTNKKYVTTETLLNSNVGGDGIERNLPTAGMESQMIPTLIYCLMQVRQEHTITFIMA